jgi:hypothetical protein
MSASLGTVLVSAHVTSSPVHDHSMLHLPNLQQPGPGGLLASGRLHSVWLPLLLKLHRSRVAARDAQECEDQMCCLAMCGLQPHPVA